MPSLPSSSREEGSPSISLHPQPSPPHQAFCWDIALGFAQVGKVKIACAGQCQDQASTPVWDLEIWIESHRRRQGLATEVMESLIRRLESGTLQRGGFPHRAILRAVTDQQNLATHRLLEKSGFLESEQECLGELGQHSPSVWVKLINQKS